MLTPNGAVSARCLQIEAIFFAAADGYGTNHPSVRPQSPGSPRQGLKAVVRRADTSAQDYRHVASRAQQSELALQGNGHCRTTCRIDDEALTDV